MKFPLTIQTITSPTNIVATIASAYDLRVNKFGIMVLIYDKATFLNLLVKIDYTQQSFTNSTSTAVLKKVFNASFFALNSSFMYGLTSFTLLGQFNLGF
jgi:hypothetical protein